MKYILKEHAASKTVGKPIYFQTMTGVGPMCTDDIKYAHKFDDRFVAATSKPMLHTLSDFVIMEVDE